MIRYLVGVVLVIVLLVFLTKINGVTGNAIWFNPWGMEDSDCRFECLNAYDKCDTYSNNEHTNCTLEVRWWQILKMFKCDYALNNEIKICNQLYNECTTTCEKEG